MLSWTRAAWIVPSALDISDKPKPQNSLQPIVSNEWKKAPEAFQQAPLKDLLNDYLR